MIKDLLINKTSKEKAQIKSFEIAKKGTKFAGFYTSAQYGVKIEIIGDVKAIEINGQHGIELFAKAWRGTQQLGFGADGSVEIERFRIFNPPILVDDPNGTIIRKGSIDVLSGQVFPDRYFREDPIERIRKEIAHNVILVGKDNNRIVIGKIGNTTSTFYPNVDNWLGYNALNSSLSTLRAGAGDESDAADTVIRAPLLRVQTSTSGLFGNLRRGLVFFDTSAIPDTDNISSGTISVVGQYKDNGLGSSGGLHIAQGNAASDTSIVTADYAQANHGTTSFGNIAYADFTTVLGTYNDITLNASGIAAISKTGKSKFSFQHGDDLNNSFSGTWIADGYTLTYFYSVDQTDTTSDPKLVVVHSAPDLSINIVDTLAITESVTCSNSQLGNISVNDTLSITESVTVLIPTLVPSVSDTIALTESVTVLIPTLLLSVSDTIAITESVTVLIPTLLLSVSDTLAITESVTVLIPTLLLSVSDTLAITESVGQTFVLNISLSDTLAITESVTISNSQLGGINVNDTSSITESVTVLIPTLVPSVSDTIAITESVTVLIPTLVPSVSDTIAITESVTVLIPTLVPSVSDTLAITESVTVSNSQLGDININDTSNITENITMFETEEGGNPSVSDTLILTENLTVSMSLLGDISLNETLTLTESVTMFETETGGNPEVSDTLAISESITLENFRFSPSRTVPVGSVRVFAPYGK